MDFNRQKQNTRSRWEDRQSNYAAAIIATSTMDSTSSTQTSMICTAIMHENARDQVQRLAMGTMDISNTSFANTFD